MHLQAHSRAFVNFQPVEVHRTSMVRKRRLATQAGSSWSWGDSPASSISSASIPPSDWYFSESSHRLDAERVFGRGWQIADVHPLSPGTYRSGTLSNGSGATEYLLVKAEDGTLRGFHNVRSPPFPSAWRLTRRDTDCNRTARALSAGLQAPCCSCCGWQWMR